MEFHINKERDSLFIYMCDDLLGVNVMKEKLGQTHMHEGEWMKN